MQGDTQTRPDWLHRTSVMVTIGVGAVTLFGGVGALLADDGPSTADRFRARVTESLCGDLQAAVQTSQPELYAGPDAQIRKAAWLAAMDTTAGYLRRGRETLQALAPPPEAARGSGRRPAMPGASSSASGATITARPPAGQQSS